jgi:hypothetical protein
MLTIQCPSLPIDTARAAQSAFGREHPYLKMGEALEGILENLAFPAVRSPDVYLSNTLYPYALLTALQYWEYLTDRQMAHATRTRLDMKYALHFPLNFPGIEPSTLCEFRRHVLANANAAEMLGEIMQHLSRYANHEKALPDPLRMMAEICLPSRAEIIFECMGLALEAIASRNPFWLKTHTLPHWYRRYHAKNGAQKLPTDPKEIRLFVESIGNDGRFLLKVIEDSNASALRNLPEIQHLRFEWKRQFITEADPLRFRASHCLLCRSERL